MVKEKYAWKDSNKLLKLAKSYRIVPLVIIIFFFFYWLSLSSCPLGPSFIILLFFVEYREEEEATGSRWRCCVRSFSLESLRRSRNEEINSDDIYLFLEYYGSNFFVNWSEGVRGERH